jgi:hypothetical protein
MQAIEFESDTQDGMIKIPETYRPWFGKTCKVILLTEDPINPPNLAEAFYLLTSLSEDFMSEGREQLPLQIREDD